MATERTAVCPECGQAVRIVTLTIPTARNQSSGRARMIDTHDHPDWPGQLCPGAYTSPRTQKKES
jgi:hypothetical protein